MNKIILLGNMTREPKTTRKKNEDGSEMVITKFDLAVNRRNKQEGNADADFFHCTSFGRQAEYPGEEVHCRAGQVDEPLLQIGEACRLPAGNTDSKGTQVNLSGCGPEEPHSQQMAHFVESHYR